MTEKIDPELVDDKDEPEISDDVTPVDLPDYDPDQFELPDDYEYDEEEGEEDGSEE